MIRHRRIVLTAAVIAAAVAGCSPSGSPGHGPPPPPSQDVRPLSGVTALTYGESVRLHERQEQAVATCMRERGHTYEPRPRTASARSVETNPYGLLDADTARTDGYGITGEFLHQKSAPPSDEASHPRQWERDLTGDPDRRVRLELPDGSQVEFPSDGCVATSRAQLYGKDWDRVEPVAVALANSVISAVGENPAYREGERAWSTCMEREGHPARNVQEPREQIAGQLREATGSEAVAEVGRRELEVAAVDAACQRSAGLDTAVRKAQRAVEQSTLDRRDREVIARYRTMKESALTQTDGKPSAVG